MTISLRLKTAMDSAGIASQSELARQSGIPQPTIYRMLHRPGKRGPATDTLRRLAMTCGVSFQWLADGTNPQHGTVRRTRRAKANSGPEDKNRPADLQSGRLENAAEPVRIRQVQWRMSAGAATLDVLAEETAQDGPYLARGWLERRGYDDRKLIALAMADESMAPSLYVGDTAIVDLTDTQPKDGEVFVVHYEGMVLIRRLVRDASAWWLCADSTDQRRFRRQQCTGPQCAIIGRIVYRLSENI
jgi:phage repressor protein C with HTH and peptisase S24 domain